MGESSRVSGFTPLVEELRPAPDAEEAFQALCRRPKCIFLDSALRHPTLGRYSFVAADPFDYVELPADGTVPDPVDRELALEPELIIADGLRLTASHRGPRRLREGRQRSLGLS